MDCNIAAVQRPLLACRFPTSFVLAAVGLSQVTFLTPARRASPRLLPVRELFRDYGAAIGPTLAFVLGLLTLVAKHGLDKRAARKDAERRMKSIIEMVKLS